jgi:hypothetical protein
MTVVQAKVATASGGKYVQQLCKHWAHKLPVNLDGDAGTVTFPGAVITMTGAPDAIVFSIAGNEGDEVERLKEVVERHLDRFAFREAPLAYEWTAQ